jgi:hypothetical protein
VTQHIVVTIPADIPIYVVLEQTQKPNVPGLRRAPSGSPASAEVLRQLLELQRELNQSSASNK